MGQVKRALNEMAARGELHKDKGYPDMPRCYSGAPGWPSWPTRQLVTRSAGATRQRWAVVYDVLIAQGRLPHTTESHNPVAQRDVRGWPLSLSLSLDEWEDLRPASKGPGHEPDQGPRSRLGRPAGRPAALRGHRGQPQARCYDASGRFKGNAMARSWTLAATPVSQLSGPLGLRLGAVPATSRAFPGPGRPSGVRPACRCRGAGRSPLPSARPRGGLWRPVSARASAGACDRRSGRGPWWRPGRPWCARGSGPARLCGQSSIVKRVADR